ncbi:hypothetical protein AB0O34_32070 [Sphaerisporangium sp. NPDC088356]|uniref:hypothetical protein n=1 Tax=Sphaerisporangium sp. NPDC088356 TaxID=3154871 RepID=UPI00341CCF02
MRRSSASITSLALTAGSILWAATPAQAASTQAASTQVVSVQAAPTGAPKAKAYVWYPTGIRRGGVATFRYKATHLRRLVSDGLVLAAFLPKNTVSKVRFTSKPSHAKCGYSASRAYCVVPLRGADTISMTMQVWIKYKYAGNYYVGHYARAVALESGLSTRDYVDEVARGDLIHKSKTIISRR